MPTRTSALPGATFFSGIILLSFLLLPILAEAKDVTITFVPPPIEGRISMGVFSEEGKCVRILKSHADFDAFEKGLNGLITTWDGKTDAGEIAPAGTYEVRGLVVGASMKSAAMTLLGNTWPANSLEERIRDIAAVASDEDDSWTLLGIRMDGNATLIHIDKSHEISAITPLDFPATMLASEKGISIAASKNRVLRVDEKGSVSEIASGENISAITLNEERVFIADAQQLRILDTESSFPEFPAPPTSIAVNGEQLVAVINGQLFLHKETQWQPMEMELLEHAITVFMDHNKTLWVTDHGREFPGLKQFSMEGELLRYQEPENGLLPFAIAVSDSGTLLLHESHVSRIRTRTLSLETTASENGQPVSKWRIGWERGIMRLQPGEVPEGFNAVELTLPPNALLENKTSKLTVESVTENGMLLLKTSGGLPILRLAHVDGDAQLEHADSRNDLKVTLYDSAGTTTFIIQNARQMLLFHAGQYRWNGSGESVNK